MEKAEYNNYPSNAVKAADKPIVSYRLVGSHFDNKTGQLTKGRDISLPSKQGILIDGEYYDIAYITGTGEGGVPIFGDIHISKGSFCQLNLDMRKPKNKRLYEYLELANFNKSNPNRDPSSRVLIEKIEPGAEAKAKREKKKKGREAVKIAMILSDQDIKKFYDKQGWRKIEDIEEMRYRVEEFAEEYPTRFLTSDLEDNDAQVESVIGAAVKEERLIKNKEAGQWELPDGEVLATYDKKPSAGKHSAPLIEYFRTFEGVPKYNKIKEGN